MPSPRDMKTETAKEIATMSKAVRHYHKLGHGYWDYMKDLAQLNKDEPPPKAMEGLYHLLLERRKISVQNYKNDRFFMGDDGKFCVA